MDFLIQSRKRDFRTETEKLTLVSEDLFVSVPKAGFVSTLLKAVNLRLHTVY